MNYYGPSTIGPTFSGGSGFESPPSFPLSPPNPGSSVHLGGAVGRTKDFKR